jgi:alpha-2-macroglobulin
LPDLKQARPDTGGLKINLSASALVGLKDVFTALEEYPYGCTEQLASRVLPRLAAADLARFAGVATHNGPVDWIDAALGQIVERQRYDGSFGYWPGDDSQVAWLSAYALLALERGSQAGYFIPKAARSRGADALSHQLERLLSEAELAARGEPDSNPGAEHESSFVPTRHSAAELQRLRLAEAAFVADVLASLGQLRQPQVRQLATFVRDMPLSAKAQLIRAMTRTRLPASEIQPLLTEVLAGTRIGSWEARVESADPALGELFESPVRTTAWVLQAALAVDPLHPVVEKLARGLVGFRARGAYRTTQEDAWALLALEDYRRSREPVERELVASVALGSASSDARTFHTSTEQHSIDLPTRALLDVQPASISLKVNSGGPLYYAAQVTVAADGASVVELDEGLSIEKRMRAVDPSQLKAASGLSRDQSLQANLGQLVLVDLLLESVEAREQVVVEDPLPAGLEPVDLGFETTTQALSQSIESTQAELDARAAGGTWARPSRPQLVHREIHDDKVLLFLAHIEPGIHHLRYLARATTPGRFVMPPTRASCMYDPEVFGQTKSNFYVVGPAPR